MTKWTRRDETPTKSPTGNLWPVLADLQVELAGSLFFKMHHEGGRLLGCLQSRNGYQPLPLLFVSNYSTVHNKAGFSNPGLHEALKWNSFTSHKHVWNLLIHILFIGYSLHFKSSSWMSENANRQTCGAGYKINSACFLVWKCHHTIIFIL